MPVRHLIARAPRPTGAITWVGVVMLLGALGLGYLAWVWVPVYSLDYDVRQTTRAVGNQGVHNKDDARLQGELSARLRGLDRMAMPGDDGQLTVQPLVNVAPVDMTWERTESPPSLHVAFAYERPVHYPILDKWVWKRMEVDLDMDLELPDWKAK